MRVDRCGGLLIVLFFCAAWSAAAQETTVVPNTTSVPVASLGTDIEAIGGLVVQTLLNATANTTADSFDTTISTIAVMEGVITSTEEVNVTHTTVADGFEDSVYVNFTSDVAGLEFRRNIFSRMKSDHPSVQALLIQAVSVVSGSSLVAPTVAPEADDDVEDSTISRDGLVALIVVGVIVVVLLVVVVAVMWTRRHKAFAVVRPMAPGAPPVKLETSRTLRHDASLSRMPSFSRSNVSMRSVSRAGTDSRMFGNSSQTPPPPEHPGAPAEL